MLRLSVVALCLIMAGCCGEEHCKSDRVSEEDSYNDDIQNAQGIGRNVVVSGLAFYSHDRNDFYQIESKPRKEELEIKLAPYSEMDVRLDVYNADRERIFSKNENIEDSDEIYPIEFLKFDAEQDKPYFVGVHLLSGKGGYELRIKAKTIDE